ncbi:MAG: TorF family putative porin [Pseudomonadota bacterium]
MTIKNSVAVGLAALGISATAYADISGSLTITSDYLSRGVSQINNQPAVQGSIDAMLDEGLYASAWISNVAGGSELDLSAGLVGSTDKMDYDLGVVRYIYPNHDDADYTELYATLGFDALSAGVKYTVGSDVEDTDQGNEKFVTGDLYYFVSASTPFYEGWDLAGTVGYYDFADDGVANMNTTYQHMEVSLSKAINDLGTLTLAVSKASRESGNNNAQFSVSWGQSF